MQVPPKFKVKKGQRITDNLFLGDPIGKGLQVRREEAEMYMYTLWLTQVAILHFSSLVVISAGAGP